MRRPERAGPGRLFLPHRLPGTPLRGELLARPNRFLGVVRLATGETIEAHIADRGRLESILYPGAEVWVVPAAKEGRRTDFSLLCARSPPLRPGGPTPLVSIDPFGANRLVRALLEAGLLAGIPDWTELRQEVRAGASRFDLALQLAAGGTMFVEVKSAAAASGAAALFPDAPSERACRHCRELAERCRAGGRAAVVFVAQRPDVEEIRPHPVDPAFAEALAEARQAGVLLLGVAFETRLDGFRWAGMRPVATEPPR